MNTGVMQQKNKIHPHKFTLWIALGSIVMMFAGLTSAYIVKRNQADWTSFEIPKLFWYSTSAIFLSSILLHLAGKAFKQREMAKYRQLVTATTVLGVLFLICQIVGFKQLWYSGNTLQSTVSYSFLYVIVGLHGLHVIGGVIALILLFGKAFNTKVKNYSSISVDLVSTYWHFVDGLWIYLLIFLLMIR